MLAQKYPIVRVLKANIDNQERGFLQSRVQRQPLGICTGAEFGRDNQELENRVYACNVALFCPFWGMIHLVAGPSRCGESGQNEDSAAHTGIRKNGSKAAAKNPGPDADLRSQIKHKALQTFQAFICYYAYG